MKVTNIGQIFICEKCENEVIVTKVGSGKLECCEQPMKLIEKNEFEVFDEEDEESE
jgi:desulfoferrodoxin-like iron-binding protein